MRPSKITNTACKKAIYASRAPSLQSTGSFQVSSRLSRSHEISSSVFFWSPNRDPSPDFKVFWKTAELTVILIVLPVLRKEYEADVTAACVLVIDS